MANALFLSNVAARAMADTLAAQIDAGTQAVLRIYSGTAPADADAALSGNTLLAELTFSTTAFGAATDANPGGRITANAIAPDTSADATGTATFCRVLTQAASGVVVVQGSVGTSAADLIVGTTAFTAGSNVAVSAMTITVVEG